MKHAKKIVVFQKKENWCRDIKRTLPEIDTNESILFHFLSLLFVKQTGIRKTKRKGERNGS